MHPATMPHNMPICARMQYRYFGHVFLLLHLYSHFLIQLLCFFQCYKSRIRDSFGEERVNRGCIMSQDQIPMYCNHNLGSNIGGPRKRNTQAFINLACCTGDFCNDGDFPELPAPLDGKYSYGSMLYW